jgi:hypothetical protein
MATTNSNHYSLYDTNNYKTELTNTIGDIVNKYNVLLIEYLKFIHENSTSTSTSTTKYNKFIIERGLETITHVFILILYYSNNVDMAYYHGQKSFYFYVEFIEQISKEQHTFLNLSSRDASMFVYKKTIFEISNDVRKHGKVVGNQEKLDLLTINIRIFKNIVYFSLQHTSSVDELVKYIEDICNKLLKYKFTCEDYTIIESFIHLMNVEELLLSKYYEIIDLFIQKYSKSQPMSSTTTMKETKLKEKFNSGNTKIDDTPEKFIKWIFS